MHIKKGNKKNYIILVGYNNFILKKIFYLQFKYNKFIIKNLYV